ncbi:MAG TPA: hypothetical protein QGF58_05970 [Myxococcota bacterium]|nr:hypothetical protein [Myxococcota bacterium]
MTEAVSLYEDSVDFTDETGIEMGYIVGLFEGMDPGPPPPEMAAEYHERLGSPDLPVLADTEGLLLDVTPYDGRSLPGKCALSPEMEMLECTTGHGLEELRDVIAEHAGS